MKLNSANDTNNTNNTNNGNGDKKSADINWLHVGGAAALGAGLAVGGMYAAGKIGGTPKA